MRRFFVLILCLVCTARTVSAETRQLVINSVVVDPVSGLSLVSGKYLGSNPTVTINDIRVQVLSGSSSLLLIELPASVRSQRGTYRLAINRDHTPAVFDYICARDRWFRSVDWNGGATGPQGPAGPAGPWDPLEP